MFVCVCVCDSVFEWVRVSVTWRKRMLPDSYTYLKIANIEPNISNGMEQQIQKLCFSHLSAQTSFSRQSFGILQFCEYLVNGDR